eukprot:1123743-Rhodomonas_salina.3
MGWRDALAWKSRQGGRLEVLLSRLGQSNDVATDTDDDDDDDGDDDLDDDGGDDSQPNEQHKDEGRDEDRDEDWGEDENRAMVHDRTRMRRMAAHTTQTMRIMMAGSATDDVPLYETDGTWQAVCEADGETDGVFCSIQEHEECQTRPRLGNKQACGRGRHGGEGSGGPSEGPTRSARSHQGIIQT